MTRRYRYVTKFYEHYPLLEPYEQFLYITPKRTVKILPEYFKPVRYLKVLLRDMSESAMLFTLESIITGYSFQLWTGELHFKDPVRSLNINTYYMKTVLNDIGTHVSLFGGSLSSVSLRARIYEHDIVNLNR